MFESSELSALDDFFADNWITDVLGVVKSGKEATVYCCRAAPRTGRHYVAAKVYRPREARGFQNDAVYRQDRVITDRRLRRAVQNKSRAGRDAQFDLWLEHEYDVLRRLFDAGAAVPEPFARTERALLLEWLGDGQTPAPQLVGVSLTPNEARRAFETLLDNVALWLRCDCVHGDLSPYNILYGRGRVTVIDFPQAVNPAVNPAAHDLLARDIASVCRHFARCGIRADPGRLTRGLWTRYQRGEL